MRFVTVSATARVQTAIDADSMAVFCYLSAIEIDDAPITWIRHLNGISILGFWRFRISVTIGRIRCCIMPP